MAVTQQEPEECPRFADAKLQLDLAHAYLVEIENDLKTGRVPSSVDCQETHRHALRALNLALEKYAKTLNATSNLAAQGNIREEAHLRRRRLWPIPLFLSITLLLVAGAFYLNSAIDHLDLRVSQLNASLESGLSLLRGDHTSFAFATVRNLDDLRGQIDEQRARVDRASSAEERQTEELIRRMQSEQRRSQAQMNRSLGEIRQATNTTDEKVADVVKRVSAVDSRAVKIRSALDETIADLKSVKGDLGVQSGLIATNSHELAALKVLGDRNYIDFDLRKIHDPQRIGNINVRVRKTDSKHNQFTLDIIADDKTVEKKDRSINEPVQFYLSRAKQPYELVVNQVQRERIIGYLAIPKTFSR